MLFSKSKSANKNQANDAEDQTESEKLKDDSEVIFSRISPEIHVDSRLQARSWQPRDSPEPTVVNHEMKASRVAAAPQIELFDPLLLTKTFIKKIRGKGKDEAEVPITNSIEGLLHFLTAPNIRKPNPLIIFLLLKFSYGIETYVTSSKLQLAPFELVRYCIVESRPHEFELSDKDNPKVFLCFAQDPQTPCIQNEVYAKLKKLCTGNLALLRSKIFIPSTHSRIIFSEPHYEAYARVFNSWACNRMKKMPKCYHSFEVEQVFNFHCNDHSKNGFETTCEEEPSSANEGPKGIEVISLNEALVLSETFHARQAASEDKVAKTFPSLAISLPKFYPFSFVPGEYLCKPHTEKSSIMHVQYSPPNASDILSRNVSLPIRFSVPAYEAFPEVRDSLQEPREIYDAELNEDSKSSGKQVEELDHFLMSHEGRSRGSECQTEEEYKDFPKKLHGGDFSEFFH